MKVKKLFKSLLVVALVVPFVLGLTACGKDYKKIDAADAYKTLTDYVAAQSTAQTSPKKFTYTMVMVSDGVEYKQAFGFDISGETPANNFFKAEWADGVVQEQKFTAGTGTDKKIYEYALDGEEGAWSPAVAFTNEQFQTDFAAGMSEYASNMEMIDFLIPNAGTTTMEQYVAGIKEVYESGSDSVEVSLEGKKYKDGSVALCVKVDVTTGETTETSTAELVIKDGQLVRVTAYDAENDASLEFVMTYDYLSSQYVPTDLSKCVPAEA